MVSDMLTLGFIINPIAGMGGRVGLKGTDGPEVYQEALERGAEPSSREEMIKSIAALRRFIQGKPVFCALLCGDSMGGDRVDEAIYRINDIEVRYVYESVSDPTTSRDTVDAVKAMMDEGADLILFAGGDGTARDIIRGMEEYTSPEPCMILGVPAGVKMHSSVFALSPGSAGELAAAFVKGDTYPSDREVMDVDEDNYRSGVLSVRLYGYARVPILEGKVQHSKSTEYGNDGMDKEGIAEEMTFTIEEDDGHVYFLGAGSTLYEIKKRLGIEGALLGVDAVRGRELIGKDIWEKQMLDILEKYPGKIKIVLAPIGRQGFLLGRGNQQFSPDVIRRVGVENILTVSTRAKMDEIDRLIIYTGDRELDERFPKFLKVLTAPGRYRMVRVRIA